MLGAGLVQEKGLIPPELAFKGPLRRKFMNQLYDRGIEIVSSRVFEKY
jgi:hypothetical protein